MILSDSFLDIEIGGFGTGEYDFLGTPSGFLYNVYQLGDRLIFEATNTNVAPKHGAVLLGSIGISFVSWLLRHRTP